VPFDTAYVLDIEQALQEQSPDSWRRLNGEELALPHWQGLFCAGWRIDIPAGSVRIDSLDHLLVVIDAAFPNSQPRVFAPQAKGDTQWPHVGTEGLLCLESTRLVAASGQRVLQHLSWAERLLNYSDSECRREFEREFLAYWNQNQPSCLKKRGLQILSLSKSGADSRKIVYYDDLINRRIVFSDSESELVNWLKNGGFKPESRRILSSWLHQLAWARRLKSTPR
jgi:hypothetical protein